MPAHTPSQAPIAPVLPAPTPPAVVRPMATHRPPSVPLVLHDPYFSVWSPADRLAGADTEHWTGKPQPLVSLVRVDGRVFRLLGSGDEPALPQVMTQVTPTRTIATYEGAGVRIRLTFLTPALPDDLDALSRPATYVTWSVSSSDGRAHAVSAYISASALLAVNTSDQIVSFRRSRPAGLVAVSVGTVAQPVLQKKGDDLRIDWGRAYLAAPGRGASSRFGPEAASRVAFAAGDVLGADDGAERAAADGDPSLAVSLTLGEVSATATERTAILAYDDEWSIEYFGQRLRPWWRRLSPGAKAMDASGLLRAAAKDFEKLRSRSEEFDRELTADLVAAGGEEYAYLGALAYRQSLAAQKLVADPSGAPLLVSKENFSNGCVATVDVIYPAAPLTLLFSPALTRATLQGPLAYASSERWKFPFAPHDLGTYPKANGQVYGGGETSEENQMPVEETGNMLILLLALARAEGNAEYAGRFWPTLRGWAEYLAAKGYDPESQLSTDDFAGHLARNVNLSVKAIEGLAAFARLAEMRGEKADARRYGDLAREFAAKWMREAPNEGPNAGTRLAYGKDGTWSQKYNLVWDRILRLSLFPPSLPAAEAAFYRTKLNRFGLPLDSRAEYTKLDWTVWSATLSGRKDDFEAILAPTIRFLDETPDRMPMTDWHGTTEPKKVGFQARSVVGGVFIKLLDDPNVWRKWVSRGERYEGVWAPIPTRPKYRAVTPDARTQGLLWRYRLEAPTGDWTAPEYDDSAWPEAPGGFGTAGTPGANVRTEWKTNEIFVRRTFDLPKMANPRLWIHHDEDAEVWINGVKAATLGGYTTGYEAAEISPAARRALRLGRNVVAIRVRQTTGGQFIDLGFAEAEPTRP